MTDGNNAKEKNIASSGRWVRPEYVAESGQARPLQFGYITDDEDVLNSLPLSLPLATILTSTLVLPGGIQ